MLVSWLALAPAAQGAASSTPASTATGGSDRLRGARGPGVAVQADGKIVVGGLRDDGADDDFARRPLQRRRQPRHQLRRRRQGDHRLRRPATTWPSASRSRPTARSSSAGYASGSNADFALARYNADGSLDTSFDGDGKVTTDFGTLDDAAYGVAVQADGKIVAVGATSPASMTSTSRWRATTPTAASTRASTATAR